MFKRQDKNELRKIRHQRVRRKISGTAERPRLCVYRSLKHMYAQLIDDAHGITLVSASTLDAEVKAALSSSNGENPDNSDKKSDAKAVGMELAKRALSKGLTNVVFDRGGYVYSGRVAKLAEGAREAGLEF